MTRLLGTVGCELVRPLVQIHPGVQTPRLLQGGLGLARRSAGSASVRAGCRSGTRRSGAADLVRLDDLVGAGGAEPQRPARVADLVLLEPVDHRPLVKPEAAELCRTSGRGSHEGGDELDCLAAGLDEAGSIDDHVLPIDAVVAPLRAGEPGGPLEHHARTRVPAPQLRGLQGGTTGSPRRGADGRRCGARGGRRSRRRRAPGGPPPRPPTLLLITRTDTVTKGRPWPWTAMARPPGAVVRLSTCVSRDSRQVRTRPTGWSTERARRSPRSPVTRSTSGSS